MFLQKKITLSKGVKKGRRLWGEHGRHCDCLNEGYNNRQQESLQSYFLGRAYVKLWSMRPSALPFCIRCYVRLPFCTFYMAAKMIDPSTFNLHICVRGMHFLEIKLAQSLCLYWVGLVHSSCTRYGIRKCRVLMLHCVCSQVR